MIELHSILLPFRGFIFDIDGTMIHSMKVHLKAWQQIFEKYGHPMSIKETGEVSYGINPEIVKRVIPGLSDEMVEKISDEKEALFRSLFNPEEDVIKGFIHFIDELKRLQLPIVIGSAAPNDNIDFFLNALQIRNYFVDIISEEDVSKGKPSPEVFIKASQAIDIAPEHCVVFEDSPTGAEASARAGCSTIAVLSTKSRKDFKEIQRVIHYVEDYTELMLPAPHA